MNMNGNCKIGEFKEGATLLPCVLKRQFRRYMPSFRDYCSKLMNYWRRRNPGNNKAVAWHNCSQGGTGCGKKSLMLRHLQFTSHKS